ncbi:MAG TPA: hypothetical protein VD789_05365 [Thermomicrobiales bacterium]|nr:hypothetical protein [Thermomicrobiales bacterium]
MSSPDSISERTAIAITNGDSLARAGDWVRALQAWNEAAIENISLQPAVERRLVWFLRATGQHEPARPVGTRMLVLMMLATALAATSFVLVAGEPGTTSANIWAVASWIMIAISTVCAVAGARAPRRESFDALMARARSTANRLVDDTTRNGRTI